MEEKKKAVAYLRVSTEGQFGEDKFGLDGQRSMIEKYAAENDYEIVKWYADEGISGVKDNRPALDEILFGEESGFEAVIVAKSDRVARDIKLYFYYLYVLEKKGVRLISVQENFDENNELSGIYRSIMLFVAEQERKNIMIRTSGGRRVKANNGGYSGGRVPYGYRAKGHQLEINPEEAQIVEIVFNKWEDGFTLKDTARYLNDNGFKTRKGKKFQCSGIDSIRRNKQFYLGNYKYGNMNYVKGVHKPLLAE